MTQREVNLLDNGYHWALTKYSWIIIEVYNGRIYLMGSNAICSAETFVEIDKTLIKRVSIQNLGNNESIKVEGGKSYWW